jgi:hypothetical protein
VRKWLLAGVLATAACGGGTSPSTPSTPAPVAPPALVVRDGASEASVPAEVSPPNPTVGTLTTVRAPGFLVRDAPFTGEPFYLWPQDADYVQALIYNEYFPGRRLSRWTTGFAVSPDGLDPSDVETLHEGVAEIARASGLPITVASGGAVTVVVDPAAPRFAQQPPAIAFAQMTFRGNTIVGARVVFEERRSVSSGRRSGRHNTLLHELGHVLGLGHSMDPGDVMSIGPDRRSERSFGEPERLALKLIYRWRQAGNVFPDSAPAAGAATAGERTVVIVD